ncbi:hypothetical protein QBC43DRAFT_314835 [Cladorrhinum sp. PSN259]|nr:hypothetical protein QBC43DRAFT_314835 [Cladorrhinum sp. PSN259]
MKLASYLPALLVSIVAVQAHENPTAIPHFTIAAARANSLTDISHTHKLAARSLLSTHGLHVMRSPSGTEAIVDDSLLHRGILAATGPDFVDISWDALSPTTSYLLARDGLPLVNLTAGTNVYRDINTVPGTTVSWITFIPESRIDAPTVAGKALCTYGSGYAFGGDGHGFDWTASSYRTAAHALITWSSRKVDGYTSVGTTHVYEKKSGKLVDQRTASKKDMVAKSLPAPVKNTVDIRMVTHAKNPFCPAGAIDGAFTMTVTNGGSYSIRSGEHRRMPNHHVYIYDRGRVTDVWKMKYANAACLVGSATCELAKMAGLYGNFA